MTFATVQHVAAAYAVPPLVAAWRVVQLSRAACALVLFDARDPATVRLVVRSATCPPLAAEAVPPTTWLLSRPGAGAGGRFYRPPNGATPGAACAALLWMPEHPAAERGAEPS